MQEKLKWKINVRVYNTLNSVAVHERMCSVSRRCDVVKVDSLYYLWSKCANNQLIQSSVNNYTTD